MTADSASGPKKGSGFLKASDFDNLDYSVLLENTTTRTEIHDARKVRMVEFMEKGAILRVHRHSCAKGHMLQLYVVPNRTDLKVSEMPKSEVNFPGLFIITGKVIEIAPGGSAADMITLEFYQYNEKSWKAFVGSFAKRQKEVDRIIKTMKE